MYEKIKNMPTGKLGKLLTGVIAAIMARTIINQGVELMPINSDGALIAFLMAGVMLFTLGLSILRYDTGRPLFEPLKRS